MESLIPFTLFGSGVVFGFIAIAFLIILLLSDINESGGTAFITFFAFLGLNYWWGNFPIPKILTWENIVFYITFGFIFSIIRTYFKGREMKYADEYEKKIFKLKEHVFRWWFMWPISLITWVCGHLIKDIYNFIYTKMEKFYNSIFNL